MADFLGRFLWYEYLASDFDKAQAFYKQVVGWGSERFPSPDQRYELWTRKGGDSVGGLMTLPDEVRKAGIPPHWLSYVGTPNLDAIHAKATRLGARTHMGPIGIPTVGRIVVLQDPQGAAFALYQPEKEPAAEAPPQVGEFSWHELATTDPGAAWSFYSALFGWVKTTAMDMGDLGVYQMFGRRADVPLGGIYRKPKEMAGPSSWLPYARVADVHAAAKKVTAAGGTIANGPMEVPGGDWIVMALDPQGGVFALHSMAAAAKPAAPRKAVAKKPAKKAAKKKQTPARAPAKKAAKPKKKLAKPKRKVAKRKATRKPAKRKAMRRHR
jgi:predicted enzyme related to lactoylglutathione lyase